MSQEQVVKPVDNSGHCADCDRFVCNLVFSQFGNDKVCTPCERLREWQYGLPPSNATEPGLQDSGDESEEYLSDLERAV